MANINHCMATKLYLTQNQEWLYNKAHIKVEEIEEIDEEFDQSFLETEPETHLLMEEIEEVKYERPMVQKQKVPKVKEARIQQYKPRSTRRKYTRNIQSTGGKRQREK